MNTTEPDTRAKLIAGLRELADFLITRPDVPVPDYGAELMVFATGSDEEQRAQVDEVAKTLETRPLDAAHYTVTRSFGSMRYRFVHIPESARGRHEAPQPASLPEDD